MSREKLREKTPCDDLEFFGRITASISHEMNNVISIIDQVAGLLEDHLAAAEQGFPVKPEQLKRVQEKIQFQTSRGVYIIRRLNKFAHSVDEPVLEFDLNVVMENLAGICDRFADLNRVTLLREWQEGELKLEGSPFLTQQVVYYLLRHAFAVTDNEAEVWIRTLLVGDLPAVEVTFPVSTKPKEDEPEDNWLGRAAPLADVIGATLQREIETGKSETRRCLFPLSLPKP